MDGMPSSYVIPDAATIKPTAWVLYAMAGAPGYSETTQTDVGRTVRNHLLIPGLLGE